MSVSQLESNENFNVPNSPTTPIKLEDAPKGNSHSNYILDQIMSMLKKWLWSNLKYISLILLIAQNTSTVIVMRYSRLRSDKKLYLASTAVVLTELLKFGISMVMLYYNNDLNITKTVKLLHLEIVVKIRETLKLSVPAVLYTLQNNLLFLALTHLDAVTFQITYQMKIIITALFSLIMLKKTLTPLKWSSLFILMIAVVLVQWPSDQNNTGKEFSLVGLLSVFVACISSGFSGVYLEKIMKQADTSMWIRNIQLSIMSFCVGLFGVVMADGRAIIADGFFQGYGYTVLAVIILQAVGGIVVSVVIKYADNILKGFATSISIVISSLLSFFVLSDFKPSWLFLIGTALVLVSTVMYSRPTGMKPLIPLIENETKTP